MSVAANTPLRTVVTTRVEPATLEQLPEIARLEDRTLSAEIRRAVVQHVQRYLEVPAGGRTDGAD